VERRLLLLVEARRSAAKLEATSPQVERRMLLFETARSNAVMGGTSGGPLMPSGKASLGSIVKCLDTGREALADEIGTPGLGEDATDREVVTDEIGTPGIGEDARLSQASCVPVGLGPLDALATLLVCNASDNDGGRCPPDLMELFSPGIPLFREKETSLACDFWACTSKGVDARRCQRHLLRN